MSAFRPSNRGSSMKSEGHDRSFNLRNLHEMTLKELIVVMHHNEKLLKQAKRKYVRQNIILHELVVGLLRLASEPGQDSNGLDRDGLDGDGLA